MSTTKTAVTVICDPCGRTLPTELTTVKGARGEAQRRGWRVATYGPGDRPVGPSGNAERVDICDECLNPGPVGLFSQEASDD